MGIMMSKDLEDNSELSCRIASDLRARYQSEEHRDSERYDEAAGAKKTGRFSWVWIVLVILAIVSLVCIVFI